MPPSLGVQSISDARFIDESWAIGADFFSQMIDVHAQAFTRITRLPCPDLTENLTLGDDAPGVFCEHLEQRKFGGRKLQRLSVQ